MAAAWTGRYPDTTGVVHHSKDHWLGLYPGPTLAEVARRSGYRTGAVVTNGWLANRNQGFDRGFDV